MSELDDQVTPTPATTTDWMVREARLVLEFFFFLFDRCTIWIRRGRLFRELFHQSCQLQLMGQGGAFCRPSARYAFKGVLPLACRYVDVGSSVELFGAKVYFRCRLRPLQWTLPRWKTALGAVVFVVVVLGGFWVALQRFGGVQAAAALVHSRGGASSAETSPKDGTAVDRVPTEQVLRPPDFSGGAVSGRGADAAGGVPFGPLPAAWWAKDSVSGPPVPSGP